MKKILLLLSIILLSILLISAQKLKEPKLLGTWVAGEDASEFLYHRILETSIDYKKENPDGKLVIRICSRDQFFDAFIKTDLNPLYVTTYGMYGLLSPEKTLVVLSYDCLLNGKFNISQYWFVPKDTTLKYDESFLANNIYYKDFEVYESEEQSKKELQEDFNESLMKFINELKNNSELEGVIVHNSDGRIIKKNIKKVQVTLDKQGIDVRRIKVLRKVRLDLDDNKKLYPKKNEKKSFPILVVLAVKK